MKMEYTFDELAKIKYGKNQKLVESPDGTIPIYGTGGLMGYATKALYDKPSVLIGRKGTIDKVKFIDTPFWTVDTLFYTEINEAIVLPKFLFYKMSLINFMNYNEGTTIPSLRTETLNRLVFDIPPLPTQQKIAAILSSLDDKIELNNKINTNLEQQAQALFEDFFPNVIDDDGLNKMEELITFSNGKKRPEESGIIPVFGGNGILAYTNKSNNENCCIIGRVGAYCGNVFLSQNKCWISDNAISAKSKDTDSQFFIFYLLKKANLQTRHIGSGQPLLTQGILNSISINIPQKQTIEQFNDLLKPIFDQIFNNSRQNENLVSIRDTLLPKLMNGEFEVLK